MTPACLLRTAAPTIPEVVVRVCVLVYHVGYIRTYACAYVCAVVCKTDISQCVICYATGSCICLLIPSNIHHST